MCTCLPAKLRCVSVLRVEEPTALRRLRAPSVMGQCESSRRVSRGMCLMISLSVASVTSRPHSHKHCIFFIWERLSLPTDTQMIYIMNPYTSACVLEGVYDTIFN